MQNKKVNEFVLVAVPLDTLIESGVDINGIMQIIPSNGKLIINNVKDASDYVCNDDCDNCPFNDIDCDGECDLCPCCEFCDDAELDDDESEEYFND